jgi:hypothetical protein
VLVITVISYVTLRYQRRYLVNLGIDLFFLWNTVLEEQNRGKLMSYLNLVLHLILVISKIGDKL